MVKPVAMDISDWNKWHQEYEDSNSELAHRARLVQKQVVAVVDARAPSPVSIVSICGGQGRELFGALEDHPRRGEITGRLVELDPDNAAHAREWAHRAGMDALQVVNADASLSETYDNLGRADLVILSGVFGHIDEKDQKRTVSFLREICDTDSTVVWTSYEVKPERTAFIESCFNENDFERVAFELTPNDTFGVVVERNQGIPLPLRLNRKIFSFGSSRKRREPGRSTNTDDSGG